MAPAEARCAAQQSRLSKPKNENSPPSNSEAYIISKKFFQLFKTDIKKKQNVSKCVNTQG